jgi:hypothetical protein
MSDGNVRFKFKVLGSKAARKKEEIRSGRSENPGKLMVVSPFYCRMYSFYEGDE